MNFDQLVGSIHQAHLQLDAQVSKAVNLGLTLRNWLIGHYIREYEQNGADRATYGAHLLDTLAQQLRTGLDKCYSGRYLGLCRQFHDTYPQIRKSLTSESGAAVIWKSLISELPGQGAHLPPTANDLTSPEVPGKLLLERLSFTHFTELIKCNDPLKRRFYEIETLRGNWSVRELKRQIDTLYFERSGLSTDKEALARLAHDAAEEQPQTPRQIIRDPYVFEFLGLKAKEVMGESDLEDALLDKLQEFLQELGHGFCFEARQKRLLIGDEYFFVDLVFYHRILKCHVLIELKNDAFRHEHLGQLNSYVACYRQTQMTEGDNPPVGILLCTRKNHALVEFALSGMDNALFVSRYEVELPKKDEMAAFLDMTIAELGGEDE
jgi:predicted nuclease of restriction endonuclease-like (RecB) superfamily